jgi:hypothetical protein
MTMKGDIARQLPSAQTVAPDVIVNFRREWDVDVE